MASLRRALPVLVLLPAFAHGQTSASFNATAGTYEIRDAASGWRLAGSVGANARNVGHRTGVDRIGAYDETSFEWNPGVAVRGTIRTYGAQRVAWFGLHYLEAKSGPGIAFPRFDSLPRGLKGFSYRDATFAPGGPGLNETGTPWLRFDERSHALVLSPASNFMVSKMHGNEASMGVGTNDLLKGVPKGTEQDGLLAFGDGINATWDRWGAALRALYDRKRPANDQGVVLRTFGHWTDNGADYYYNYDETKGYAGTLLALRDHYREQGIPLGYLQLDSWWYDKTLTSPSGRHEGPKRAALPHEPWNRYGGTTTYRADKSLFPDGLGAFQKRLDLPLVVHARWIDPTSSYHEDYKISDLAPVDPRWWNETADYLADNGVVVYEQDWLDEIYVNSPKFASEFGTADAFTGNMALATQRRGIDLQYCMELPKYYLQGVQYPNLTTARASDDRFDRGKWAHFLTTSELAWQIGAFPWVDVFKSHETGNLTLALLSGGPVGTGDAIGTEDKVNILRATRPDGVLVKADHPAVPCDLVYQNEAAGRKAPMLAETSTGSGDTETRYLFAFASKDAGHTLAVTTADVGVTRPSVIVDLRTGTSRPWSPDQSITFDVGTEYAYSLVAPITRTGVAMLGDLGKIVPTGRARIAAMTDGADGLLIDVAFAKGEGPVTLTGIAPRAPRVQGGKLTGYDAASGRFTVEVPNGGRTARLKIDGRI